MGWELNPGPLREQFMLLVTEPSSLTYLLIETGSLTEWEVPCQLDGLACKSSSLTLLPMLGSRACVAVLGVYMAAGSMRSSSLLRKSFILRHLPILFWFFF